VPEYETPFNLDVLRKHLANISFARQVLPGDREARQRLLEESVLTVAKDRMEHEQALLARLELGPSGLQTAGLQTWMWNWHQGLMEKLKEDIPKLLKSEKLLPARCE
jgi:DNA-directed RNA polymerase